MTFAEAPDLEADEEEEEAQGYRALEERVQIRFPRDMPDGVVVLSGARIVKSCAMRTIAS